MYDYCGKRHAREAAFRGLHPPKRDDEQPTQQHEQKPQQVQFPGRSNMFSSSRGPLTDPDLLRILRNKAEDQGTADIPEEDHIYSMHPEMLPGVGCDDVGRKEWLFFTRNKVATRSPRGVRGTAYHWKQQGPKQLVEDIDVKGWKAGFSHVLKDSRKGADDADLDLDWASIGQAAPLWRMDVFSLDKKGGGVHLEVEGANPCKTEWVLCRVRREPKKRKRLAKAGRSDGSTGSEEQENTLSGTGACQG
eukprot:TRINITY_DN1088_c0_g1_i4.p1 TRINITY_DN1088_c0_g1~~TRINITY_DN1088_c0_g1_i4.p1  ORF type:complete len:248 (-),score=28.58 TRINITY_DN1088_c0_g1_i4:183-926(-)